MRKSHRPASKREALPLPIRPSSYASVVLGRVGIIAFAVGFIPTLVLILGFQVEWLFFIEATFALVGGCGAVSSYVQNIREAEYGYTTLPWRAGELELRDPADGWIVIPAKSGAHFDTLKQAREWIGDPASRTAKSGD